IFLHQGDELAALRSQKPLAKSAEIPTTPARRRTIRETSGLPDNFRHEMLSVQIAARYANGSEGASDLFLHLIGSHHGYGRPFAPVCVDSQPPAVEGMLGDTRIAMAAQDRAQLVQPHRLDSGVAERFWKLVRRYGWWGLAYFETLLRLGDWYAS